MVQMMVYLGKTEHVKKYRLNLGPGRHWRPGQAGTGLANFDWILWNSIEVYGILENSMEFRRILWNSMRSCGIPQDPMEFHRILWDSIEFYAIPWDSMEFHGILWNSMEFFGNPESRLSGLKARSGKLEAGSRKPKARPQL